MRRHLIVNRRIALGPPSAVAHADHVNALDDSGTGPTTPDFVCGGRYPSGLRHTGTDWPIREVLVREKWRS
ncbi:hypothetical protein [Actinacidiphila sp. bgisy160]|uniref:hypothetical protein n=1 Tax=Actinacidiphila sp. bgisy160 TaxID=3413796 RepID=UPI003D711E67